MINRLALWQMLRMNAKRRGRRQGKKVCPEFQVKMRVEDLCKNGSLCRYVFQAHIKWWLEVEMEWKLSAWQITLGKERLVKYVHNIKTNWDEASAIMLSKVRLVGTWIKRREKVNQALEINIENLRKRQYKEEYGRDMTVMYQNWMKSLMQSKCGRGVWVKQTVADIAGGCLTL